MKMFFCLFVISVCGCKGDLDYDGVNAFSPDEINSKSQIILYACLDTILVLSELLYENEIGEYDTVTLKEYHFKALEWYKGNEGKFVTFWLISSANKGETPILEIGDTFIIYGEKIPLFDSIQQAVTFPIYYNFTSSDPLKEHLGDGSRSYIAFCDLTKQLYKQNIEARFNKNSPIYKTFDAFNVSELLKNKQTLFSQRNGHIKRYTPTQYLTELKQVAAQPCRSKK